MKKFSVMAVGCGVVAAPAFVLDRETKNDAVSGTPEEEIRKLRSAVERVTGELNKARQKAGDADAAIWEITRMVLEDESFLGEAERAVTEEGCSAAAALSFAGEKTAAKLEALGSEYLRSRSEDVRGVAARCVRVLQGGADDISCPSVVFARQMSPGELASLDREKVLALVTEKGNDTSHVAVLAGNWGIPYVYGGELDIAGVQTGETVIVDEAHKQVILSPDEDTLAAARESMEACRQKQAELRRISLTRTKIYANIGTPGDIPALKDSTAEGVGLFRSEFFFLGRETAPTEEEQFEAYRQAVEAMGERETVIRTVDVGSDKTAAYLHLPAEKNPALGIRGIRVSLRDPELFRCQLRALFRAAVYGREKILFPMVSDPAEIDTLRRHMEKAAQELTEQGVDFRVPPIGAMIETPSAVILSDELAKKVSFFSIGTNDLTQYALALDREAEETSRPIPLDAVYRLIGMTVENAHKQGIPVAVCGELASREEAIPRLVELGVDELSVSCGQVDAVRALVSAAEAGDPSSDAKAEEALFAPADGELIPMEEIPDAAFSSGSMGQCFGVMPEHGEIYAPVCGTVESVADTLHAVVIRTGSGRQVLLHAGIDTVRLKGSAFRCHVKPGDALTTETPVLTMDLQAVKKAGLSPMIITVLCEE